MAPRRRSRAAKALKGVAWTAVALVVLGVALIGARMIRWELEDREHARRAKIYGSPPRRLIEASAEDCAIFRAIAAQHWRPVRMWVRTDLGGYGHSGPPDRDAFRYHFELEGRRLRREFTKAALEPADRYHLRCDWQNSGLVALPTTRRMALPLACPAQASYTSGPPHWRREFPCNYDRPASLGPPHIGFHKPAISRRGDHAPIETFEWTGPLGARGFICLVSKVKSEWQVKACEFSWIS